MNDDIRNQGKDCFTRNNILKARGQEIETKPWPKKKGKRVAKSTR